MALILQLRPDLEETLSEQARARDLSLEEYAQALLEQQLTSKPEREISLEKFSAALDAVAVHSHKIAHLPLEALTRESIYKDHD